MIMAEGRFFGRLWTGLQKTRQALTESLGAVFSRKRIDAETLEELEEALILADLGAKRAGVDIIKGQPGGDAAAVAFDAVRAARARQVERVLIDTAGRLHTKVHLMEELRKMRRVLEREMPGAPHDIWLVLDATTGQNGIAQVQQFHDSLGLTGLVLTKLDGTAKGGIVINIADQFHVPIRYIGIGEGMDDLRPFDAAEFATALLER